MFRQIDLFREWIEDVDFVKATFREEQPLMREDFFANPPRNSDMRFVGAFSRVNQMGQRQQIVTMLRCLRLRKVFVEDMV